MRIQSAGCYGILFLNTEAVLDKTLSLEKQHVETEDKDLPIIKH